MTLRQAKVLRVADPRSGARASHPQRSLDIFERPLKCWNGRMPDSESQRDSISQPRVASLRATLGQRVNTVATLNGLHPLRVWTGYDATPLGLKTLLDADHPG